ncbi:MAG TPA: YihY/virulence factor BrkB family protein [Blastocatellia bacterium]|nr:YihY/virulence factor BrkB family protein [Blastocatellia bacterium]
MIKAPKLKILTRSLASFMENDLTTSAAAVSYFTLLAFFPTLVLLLAIGNKLLGPEEVEKYVIGQVLAFLPGARGFVQRNIDYVSGASSGVVLSCLVIMLWAASWIFTVIEKALNRVWGTYPRSFLHGRAVNFALMSLVWALLGVSAIFTAVVTGLRAAAGEIGLNLGPEAAMLSGYAWQTMFAVASLVVTISLFALVYKLLPNTPVPWLEALPGAVVAGVLWEGAKFGFASLLPYFHYDLVYGSIGAAVALLSWVYFSSLIMLFGAQFTALLHREHLFSGSYRNAVPGAEDVSVTVSE